MLSNEEKQRYARHIRLAEVGISGQENLKNASVLVVGAGGLGTPVLQYLTAAGIGRIGIADNDMVDVSNLQRQVLYDVNNVGHKKTDVAMRKLSVQNPNVKFDLYDERITNENVLEIVAGYDLVVDATDNFPTRYLLNDACVINKKPLVFGSIYKFEGQIAVFNFQGGPTYRCLYPNPPKEGRVPNCSEVGVMGVLPGIIGMRMANECLKIILGIGEVLNGKLLLMDTLKNKDILVNVQLNEANLKRDKLESSYEEFCGPEELLDEVTPVELHERIDSGEQFYLVDVREPFEHEICLIDGSIPIPMQRVPERLQELPRDQKVILICHHGARSASVQDFLKSRGFDNTVNLKGGIDAWAKEVDNEMALY